MKNILKIQFNPIAVYIHVGDSNEGKVYLSVFMKVSGGGRSFNIKVTQLEDNLAPNNCLQYFPEAEGLIKSFNYDTDGSNFVTMGDLRKSRRGHSHSSRPGGMKMEGIGFQYTMRYQPGFTLHKLAQQQGEDGGMDGMEEPMPMPMPTPGTPPPEPTPTQPEEEEIPMRTTVAPTEVPSMQIAQIYQKPNS